MNPKLQELKTLLAEINDLRYAGNVLYWDQATYMPSGGAEARASQLATLARLELSAEELERYREQLSAILDYVAQLQALDTAAIPPTSSVLPPRSVLRPDEARPGLEREALLRNATETEAGQFRVPPVLE